MDTFNLNGFSFTGARVFNTFRIIGSMFAPLQHPTEWVLLNPRMQNAKDYLRHHYKILLLQFVKCCYRRHDKQRLKRMGQIEKNVDTCSLLTEVGSWLHSSKTNFYHIELCQLYIVWNVLDSLRTIYIVFVFDPSRKILGEYRGRHPCPKQRVDVHSKAVSFAAQISTMNNGFPLHNVT